QGVTASSDRVDQLAVLSAVDLVTQVVDIHVNDVGECIEVLIPYVLGDHRAGQHAAGIAHQVFQEGVFLGRQLDAPAAAGHSAGGWIQDQIVHLQQASRLAAAASQQDAHAGQQFLDRKGLRQLVV